MIHLLGLNHRSASVEVREQLHFQPEEIRAALPELLRAEGVHEAMMLSTCNRTEVVLSTASRSDAVAALSGMLGRHRSGAVAAVERSAYRLDDFEAVRHIFRVAASLDSMIIGEPQILGQVKEAYAIASGASAIGPVLSSLFQKAFSCAKHVRAGTGISRHPVSVAYAAAELAGQIFGSLEGRSILVLGAGKMGKLTAKHLAGKGVDRILVASRTFDNARLLADELGGEPISYDNYKEHVKRVDILIASTAAPLHIIRKEDGPAMMKARKHRPLFMVDLAVPRNIDPELNDLSNLFVYNIDALQQVATDGMSERKKEARAAEEIVERELQGYRRWVQSLSVQPTIVDLRKRFQSVADAELERHKARLAALEPEQERIVSGLLTAVLNKLLHGPTVTLKKALEERDGADLVAHVRRLFDLGEAEPESSGAPAATDPDRETGSPTGGSEEGAKDEPPARAARP
jgi:glutamyl-tRNA reductase